jgi:hypothetical protein
MHTGMTYVVMDIQADARVPGRNSMLCLASDDCDATGRELASFEANLRPLPGAAQNPDTMTCGDSPSDGRRTGRPSG